MNVERDILLDLSFPAEYEVIPQSEIPGRPTDVLEFSRMGRVIDGGVLFEVVSSAGATWSGLAANGFETVTAAKCGIYSTPSPNRVCVVARGDAYLMEVEAPERWEALHDSPVVEVRPAVAAKRLVLATPQRLVALGPDGLAWRTARIAIDGIELGEIREDWIAGLADPRGAESREFRVNLRTGEHQGGFAFPPLD